jgi:hypothetical protein
MAVTPASAVADVPYKTNIEIATAQFTGTIIVGDWLAYSGQRVVATNSGQTAYWKTSGAGVALESNPVYDRFGNSVLNTGGKILVQGILRVSANFSGVPALGLGAYPDATGSGVAAPTGLSGVGATWQTAQVVNHSALSGTATPQAAPVATVIGATNFSNAGTGELDIRLVALAPDVRG